MKIVPYDFVRERLADKGDGCTAGNHELSHVMSGALSDHDFARNADPRLASARSVSPVSHLVFDSSFNAQNILRPTGFQTFSDLFSAQAIRTGSDHQTSTASSATPVARALSRRRIATVNDSGSSEIKSTWAVDGASSSDLGYDGASAMAASLPFELIQQVFEYLGPIDFNAAR